MMTPPDSTVIQMVFINLGISLQLETLHFTLINDTNASKCSQIGGKPKLDFSERKIDLLLYILI